MFRSVCIVAAFFCFLLLCSCQKEIAIINENPLDTTSLPSGDSYIPLTTGTFWIYKDSATGGNDTATVLADERLQNNITFRKVSITGGTEDQYTYYGVLDHNYYISGEENGIELTMLVLNDLTEVGGTWVYDMGMINNIPARGTGTILEKGISLNVQGRNYEDVIHSRYIMAYNLLGTYVDFAEYHFYFAKGVGVIKVHSSISDGMGNDMVSSQELVNYSVK